jgi:protoporphyrinogen oxidase
VVGGGLYSLVLVGALVNSGILASEILLIESSKSLGGQFRSDQGQGQGQGNLSFDRGTRILYETGDQRADGFISNVVERCKSSVLSGNKRDIGGIFVNNRLETGSVFPSFQSTSVDRQTQILGEILMRAGTKREETRKDSSSLRHYLDWQFGPTARETIHEAICRHVFNVSSTQLSVRVLEMLPLNRLSGFSHEMMVDLSKSEGLRSRLAFPDQLRLPLIRKQEYRGYYPTSPGIEKYVDAAETILREVGVHVLVGHSVARIRRASKDNRTTELLLTNTSGTSNTVRVVRRVFWTSGSRALATCAGVDKAQLPADVSRKVALSHLLIPKVDQMGELYYAYNYDSEISLFRVTNYSSYCRDSQVFGRYPITVESFADNSSESELREVVKRDLGVFLGLNRSSNLEVEFVRQSTGFFPQPRLDIEERWSCITQMIADQLEGTLCVPGIGSKSAKFLGRDVVNDLLAQFDRSEN